MPYIATFQTPDHWHAQFAARVLHWPFAAMSQYVWPDWENPVQTQLLNRQWRFLASLHPQAAAPDTTLEVRYVHRAGEELIECVLVGKVRAATEAEARTGAAAFWEQVVGLLPIGYALAPAETEAKLNDWPGWDIARAADQPTQWAEIRRRSEFLLWADTTLPLRHLPVTYPFVWQSVGWQSVWMAQQRASTDCVVAVSVHPTHVSAQEEIVVAELAQELRTVASQTSPAMAAMAGLAASYYEQALPGLRAPFSVRILTVGPVSVQRALRGLLGGPEGLRTPADSDGAAAHVPGQFNVEIVQPTAAELGIVRDNFLRLEQADWGAPPCGASNLLRPLNRLRYLTDAVGAQCAFRLPLLPPDGLPGLEVGGEFSPE